MSDVEFRALGPERYDEFAAITDYAFHPEDGPRDADAETPERIAERFGLVAGDDLVSVCAHYDFTARLRDEWVPLAGLAAVATPPERRRAGHVRRMVEESLERWRGEFPLAALWPFDRAYYEQFGWATANTTCEFVLPAEQLAFAREAAAGRARRVTADEWAALDGAYERHVAAETLGIRRDERWWRDRVFERFGDEARYVYAWERNGEVRGHVAYTVESTGEGIDDRRIAVADLAVADDDAYCGLLGFLADHDSQVSEVQLYAPEDTLLDRVPDPGAVECTVHTGPMVRVVDVAGALAATPYPADATADLTLSVTDATAPWNDGVFDLGVAGGDGECTRSDRPAAEADATIDVATLSQLVVGYRDVADARRVGDLTVVAESVAATLTELFPTETVALRDFF